jgi:hypothetical protein
VQRHAAIGSPRQIAGKAAGRILSAAPHAGPANTAFTGRGSGWHNRCFT